MKNDYYYEYLTALISDKDIWDSSKYSKLLHTLWNNELDDGSLRYQDSLFIREVVSGIQDNFLNLGYVIYVRDLKMNKTNYLEALVALSVYTATSMSDCFALTSYAENVISRIFFEMLNSLYIDAYDDEHFDEKRVLKALRNWNNYEYDDFGNGNIFRFPNAIKCLKNMSISSQIHGYSLWAKWKKEETTNE